MIYFIACEEASAVKIGLTVNRPYERLNQAQVNCPLPLVLAGLTEGGFPEERALHERFAAHRLHGEWFILTDELRDHIAQFPPPEKPARGWHGQKRNRKAPA